MNNIKKLKITNFKGIKDLELDFTYQNTDKILDNIVLYGINGTGKSTILEAIYICLTVGIAYHQDTNLSFGSKWIYNNEQEFIINIQILANEKLISATLEYHKNNGLKWKIQNNISLFQNSSIYLSSYRVLNPSTVQSAGDWNQIDKKVETLTSEKRKILENLYSMMIGIVVKLFYMIFIYKIMFKKLDL